MCDYTFCSIINVFSDAQAWDPVSMFVTLSLFNISLTLQEVIAQKIQIGG